MLSVKTGAKTERFPLPKTLLRSYNEGVINKRHCQNFYETGDKCWIEKEVRGVFTASSTAERRPSRVGFALWSVAQTVLASQFFLHKYLGKLRAAELAL